MHLTDSDIKEMLDNIKYCTVKDLIFIITDLSEHISYLERCYFDLSTKYDQLKNDLKAESEERNEQYFV